MFATIVKFLRKFPTVFPQLSSLTTQNPLSPQFGTDPLPTLGLVECLAVTKLFAAELLALEKSVGASDSDSKEMAGSGMNTYIGEILTLLSECGLMTGATPEQKNFGILVCDIRCDVCGTRPIVGPAYHCMVCPDFDICESCKGGRASELHSRPSTPSSNPGANPGVDSANTSKALWITRLFFEWNLTLPRLFTPLMTRILMTF